MNLPAQIRRPEPSDVRMLPAWALAELRKFLLDEPSGKFVFHVEHGQIRKVHTERYVAEPT